MVRRKIGKLKRDDDGQAMMMFAGALAMLVAGSALSIDIGNAYVTKRRLQGVADAAAVAAAGSTNPTAAVSSVIATYGLTDVTVMGITPGTYTADSTLTPASRFVAGTSGNAAQVVLAETSPSFFGHVFNSNKMLTVNASGLASRTNLAAFSVGTRIAGLSGGLINSWLSALTGSTISLSVGDSSALVGGDIDLLAFSNALRTSENLGVATYSQTLSSQTTLPVLVSAMAAAATDSSTAAALTHLAALLPATPITPSTLINLGPMGADVAIPGSTSVAVNALAMIDQSLLLSNGSSELTLNLGATIPGVTSTTAKIVVAPRVVNSPWIAIGQAGGVTVTASSAHIVLNASVADPLLTGSPLINLPVSIDLGQASAQLSALSCGAGRVAQSATLAVTPSVGTIAIGSVTQAAMLNFTQPMPITSATLLNVAGLVTVTGSAIVKLGGASAQAVTFSASQIASQSVQTVSTSDVVSAAVTSLLSTLQLQVNVLGLGIGLGGLGSSAITAGLLQTLNGVSSGLDSVVFSLTGMLGLGIGEADVRMNGVSCGVPAVVG